MVHALALFEDSDVLCLSDREGERIDCVKAGLTLPPSSIQPADKDETGEQVVAYTGVGRSYGIAAKGEWVIIDIVCVGFYVRPKIYLGFFSV